MTESEQVIAEGFPPLLRALERARLDCGGLAAMTAHIATNDGEVLVTVRADGTASAGYEDHVADVTPAFEAAVRR